MRKKYISVIVIALFGLGGTFALAAQRENSSFIDILTQPLVNLGFSQTKEMAKKNLASTTDKTVKLSGVTEESTEIEKDKKDLVDFYVLFKFADFLEKEAKKAELVGEDTAEYRQFFIKEAQITETQNEQFRQIVSDCLREVAETDSQAEKIIEREHEKLKKIDFTALGNARLPEVPELNELQKRRDDTILRYRDLLKNQFGDDAFARFQKEYINKKVTPNITDISSAQPTENKSIEEVK
jgi:hypothetical protein